MRDSDAAGFMSQVLTTIIKVAALFLIMEDTVHNQLKAHNHKAFLLFRGNGTGGISVALERSSMKTQEESALLALVRPESLEGTCIIPAPSTARSICKRDALPGLSTNETLFLLLLLLLLIGWKDENPDNPE